MIKVIIKAMKFNEEEADKILAFHEENNRSAFGRVNKLFFQLNIDNWRFLLTIISFTLILS